MDNQDQVSLSLNTVLISEFSNLMWQTFYTILRNKTDINVIIDLNVKNRKILKN